MDIIALLLSMWVSYNASTTGEIKTSDYVYTGENVFWVLTSDYRTKGYVIPSKNCIVLYENPVSPYLVGNVHQTDYAKNLYKDFSLQSVNQDISISKCNNR